MTNATQLIPYYDQGFEVLRSFHISHREINMRCEKNRNVRYSHDMHGMKFSMRVQDFTLCQDGRTWE